MTVQRVWWYDKEGQVCLGEIIKYMRVNAMVLQENGNVVKVRIDKLYNIGE